MEILRNFKMQKIKLLISFKIFFTLFIMGNVTADQWDDLNKKRHRYSVFKSDTEMYRDMSGAAISGWGPIGSIAGKLSDGFFNSMVRQKKFLYEVSLQSSFSKEYKKLGKKLDPSLTVQEHLNNLNLTFDDVLLRSLGSEFRKDNLYTRMTSDFQDSLLNLKINKHQELTGEQLSTLKKIILKKNKLQDEAWEKTAKSLRDVIDILDAKVEKNKDNQLLLASFLYGDSSSEMQEALLEHDLMGLPSEEKERLLQGIKDKKQSMAEKQIEQEAISNFKEFFSEASQIASLFASAFPESEELQNMAEFISISNVMINSLTEIATDPSSYIGYTGIIKLGLSILSSGAQKSAAEAKAKLEAQRHFEIMRGISHLRKQLSAINEKINVLLKGQNNILKNQEYILNKLESIEYRLAQINKNINIEINKNYDLLVKIKEKLGNDFLQNQNACDLIGEDLKNQVEVSNRSFKLENCLKFYDDLFLINLSQMVDFLNYETPEVIQKQYFSLYKMSIDHFVDNDSFYTSSTLRKENEQTLLAKDINTSFIDINLIREKGNRLVNINVLSSVVRTVKNSLPLILERFDDRYTVRDITNKLEDLLKIHNFSSLQQNILYGDENFLRIVSLTEPHLISTELKDAFSSNEFLLKNFLSFHWSSLISRYRFKNYVSEFEIFDFESFHPLYNSELVRLRQENYVELIVHDQRLKINDFSFNEFIHRKRYYSKNTDKLIYSQNILINLLVKL